MTKNFVVRPVCLVGSSCTNPSDGQHPKPFDCVFERPDFEKSHSRDVTDKGTYWGRTGGAPVLETEGEPSPFPGTSEVQVFVDSRERTEHTGPNDAYGTETTLTIMTLTDGETPLGDDDGVSFRGSTLETFYQYNLTLCHSGRHSFLRVRQKKKRPHPHERYTIWNCHLARELSSGFTKIVIFYRGSKVQLYTRSTKTLS